MPTVRIPQPGVAGMVTNRPPHMLGAQEAVYIQDAHLINGVLHQRRGIQRDGSSTVVASNLGGVYRAKFVTADVTRTIAVTTGGTLYIHNGSSSGTSLGTSAPYPRCMYRDYLLMSDPSHTVPVTMYSGGATSSISISSGTPVIQAGKAIVSGATYASAPTAGMFLKKVVSPAPADGQQFHYMRILVGSTTSMTLENIKAGVGSTLSTTLAKAFSLATSFPSITVRDEATGTVAGSGVVTGVGTAFASSDVGKHLIVIPDNADLEMGYIDSYTSATAISALVNIQASQCKFLVNDSITAADVASHRGSLFCGNTPSFPARIWIAPPDWDMNSPPGLTIPWDTSGSVAYPSDVWTLDFEDIGSYDDPIVAVLSTAGPLLILKTSSTHRYDGTYPSFTQSVVDDGVGCIDLRSAISVDEGVFWADRQGVYTFTGQRCVNLMAGKVDNEWRALVNEGITYCSSGMAPGRNLLVSVKTNSTSRTYQYALDTGAWSYVSNVIARYYNTARISGEIDALFFVDDNDQGRVLDIAPAYTNVKVTDRDAQTVATADATDDYGAGSAGPPNLKYHSPANLTGDTDTEARMVTVTVRCNMRDSATPTTVLTPYHVASGGLGRGASESTKTLTTITADTTDLTDRYQLDVNRTGRTHQIKCEITTLDSTDNTKVELQEIICDFRPSRKGS